MKQCYSEIQLRHASISRDDEHTDTDTETRKVILLYGYSNYFTRKIQQHSSEWAEIVLYAQNI